jgi:hypothetical protein
MLPEEAERSRLEHVEEVIAKHGCACSNRASKKTVVLALEREQKLVNETKVGTHNTT